MLHGVATPGLPFPAVDEAVDSPGTGPHQLGACLVVLGFFQCYGGVFDDVAHQPLHKAVEHFKVFVHIEVDLQNVAHHVGRAAGGLVGVDAEGGGGIGEAPGGI